jgi:ATP-dependent Lon protease
VTGEHIEEAIRRTKRRADLPSRRFREYLADGTIRIQTSGSVVGQVNGLAVIRAGPIMYGFPARITASMGAGSAGIINIEGQAQLSGAIHTKGFHILGGLLRHLLKADHPLAFSASVAFEQSYGGIDGDSASGAEICCLLSALTRIPIKQELAITGAIDQVGHLQAIGGVNEKIEGFFETCRDLGLTGNQGVVIPRSNAGDLMLRRDVVEACSGGGFHVYAVETIQEALEVLTGVAAGQPDEEGAYPEESLLGKAVEQARQYWLKSVFRPEIKLATEEETEEEEEEEGAEDEEAAAEPS